MEATDRHADKNEGHGGATHEAAAISRYRSLATVSQAADHDADDSAGRGWVIPEARHTCPWAREDAEAGHFSAADIDYAASSTGTPEGTPSGAPQGGTPEGGSAGHGEPQQVSVHPTVVRAPMARYDAEAPASVREWNGLPSDFLLHLRLFEKVSKQAHVLDQLSKQQEKTLSVLRGMQQQIHAFTQEGPQQTSTASQVADMRKELRKLQESQAELTEAVQISSDKADEHHDRVRELLIPTLLPMNSGGEEAGAEEADDLQQVSPSPSFLQAGSLDDFVSRAVGVCPQNSGPDENGEEEEGSPKPGQGAGWSRRTKYYFKNGKGNRLLETICATVIVANAITMGVKTDMTAKADIGGQESSPAMWAFMNGLERFFVCFYTVEFLFKYWLFRRDMFSGPDWKWNWFDLLLLLLAYFEGFASVANLEQAGVDVTWMRLLRLLKMLKMLRVVRVMRFFKELRNMLSSLIGSATTLMWSLLMIFLITYIFGLIFLQAVAGYIEGMSGAENLDEETSGNVNAYWNSVSQAVVTLFMAVTGGSDWEPLAQPFKVMPETGQLYYMIFLLYIAFSMIAVLNVLTGMFVDSAMKVAVADEGQVFEEIMEKYRGQMEAFTVFLKDLDKAGSGAVQWPLLKQNLQSKPVKEFVKALEMEPADLYRIHKNLNRDAGVPIDDFIEACAKCRGDTRDIEILGLQADFKRYAQQLGHMMEYTEERFNEVHAVFRRMGASASKVRPLGHRLVASCALPPTWSSTLDSYGTPAETPNGSPKFDRQGATGSDHFADLALSCRVKVMHAGHKHRQDLQRAYAHQAKVS